SIYRLRRADPHPIVAVRRRGDLSGDPRVWGIIGRIILGLATAFGLGPAYAHAGNVYLVVKSNDAMLAATLQPFAIALLAAIVAALACGFLLAGGLTRQWMRPLADAFAQRDRANAAMRQFIADAGHQLRTPLTIVQGFIDILRRSESTTPDERKHILDTMYRQSRVMSSLIDKLILLERWERRGDGASSEPIDVGVLVSDLIAPIAESHPGRRISVASGDGLLAAIDPTELGYVVNNIVDNAVKYTKGDVAVRVNGDDASVFVEVRDEGPGMSHQDAARAFDRFYRGSQRSVEGSGLGLAIAKRAVERARGTISVETSAGGSRFRVSLPREEKAPDGFRA
ncbi:MAG: HAMP domain-containing histidine kinase, partial [Candidatus Eremiobacteraeota bacterium]|nr:HAMP domain-containing histidine kinase [Candidatus Eremiobacteraeota bacterium]